MHAKGCFVRRNIFGIGNIARLAEFHILLEQNHKQKELEREA
jgi:hypothetical protein